MLRSRLLAAALLSALALPWAAQAQQAAPASPAKPSAPAMAPATAPAAKPATAPAATPAKLIDINSATKEELDALPGIGAARSEAIVKNRPYKGKDDLVRKKIIPQNVYDQIKDRIIAKQA